MPTGKPLRVTTNHKLEMTVMEERHQLRSSMPALSLALRKCNKSETFSSSKKTKTHFRKKNYTHKKNVLTHLPNVSPAGGSNKRVPMTRTRFTAWCPSEPQRDNSPCWSGLKQTQLVTPFFFCFCVFFLGFVFSFSFQTCMWK